MQTIYTGGQPTPTANLAINKSRVKLYNKNEKVPTYYLQKGQEFQIELYNPTRDKILAKIHLNGKPIAQGGLVLRPGERVFLDRYIDVPNKFKFDTYDVSNSEETRKAIEDNGDFKVEFHREQQQSNNYYDYNYWNNYWNQPIFGSGSPNFNYRGTTSISGTLTTTAGIGLCSANASTYTSNANDSLNFMDAEVERTKDLDKLSRKRSMSKSIETGRVEKGSESNQKLDVVYLNWESWAFHTVEYKLLPVSQKINTTQDLNVKRYCTSCGFKLNKTDRFCSQCGGKN